MRTVTFEQQQVPVLPRASEVREVVESVERGLKFLRGLALAVERVERRAIQAAAGGGESPAPAAAGSA